MIISRSPFRISLAGGGSDYPQYFQSEEGNCVGFSMDSYVYVATSRLHGTSREKFKISYRITESVSALEEILHPTVRELLKELNWTLPISINTFADIPARNGLGGSSAFIAALIKSLHLLENKFISKQEIAKLAILIERIRAQESGGFQDQYMTSFGSLRNFSFFGDKVKVSEPLLSESYLDNLEKSFFITPLKVTRNTDSAEFTKNLFQSEMSAVDSARKTSALSQDFTDFLLSNNSLNDIVEACGYTVAKSHEFKTAFTEIPDETNKICEELKKAGSIGSKLCGAGSGGFIFSVVPTRNIPKFQSLTKELHTSHISISRNGTEFANLDWTQHV